MKKITYIFLLFSASLFAQISEFIHLDQFGYAPQSTKVAVLSNPQVGYNQNLSYSPSSSLQIRNASTDEVITSIAPVPWNNGTTHSQSGDQGWWLDFSSLETPGQYYIYDVDRNERSATFEIMATVYNDILKASVKMFYYNRCGSTKEASNVPVGYADGMNFQQDEFARDVYDQNNAASAKDMRGGWFDAGDYNKYVTFAETAVHDLLWSYRLYPDLFTDDFDIPESGNGIPDILDELKWELDWLLKMVNPDGSVHIKIGSRNYGENVSAPPSANSDIRYYAPVCTSAALATTTMFAHAAKVFENVPGMSAYATQLEQTALLNWNWVLPALTNGNLDTNCDDGSVVAGDADRNVQDQLEMALNAAIYLFDLTGDTTFNQYVIDNIGITDVINNGQWDNYNVNNIDALLHYTSLSGADSATSTLILNDAFDDASNNYNDYFQFTDLSLYREYTNDWTYHWGSTSSKARMGILNQQFQFYNINANNASYDLRAKETLHYFHGVNPLGLVLLSNMYALGAERSVNQIYHTWFYDGTIWDDAINSTYGPAPGFLTGGPNPNYSANTNLSPPFNQPLMKSYLDFNDGNPNNSWEISEPGIYYQSAYVRLLAGVISKQNENNLSTTDVIIEESLFELYPNPTKNSFRVNGAFSETIKLEIYSLNGQLVYNDEAYNIGNEISTNSFSNGIYLVKLNSTKSSKTLKLIVQ